MNPPKKEIYLGTVTYYTGDFKTYHLVLPEASIIVREEGFLGGGGGYPFVGLGRRDATQYDLKELSEPTPAVRRISFS